MSCQGRRHAPFEFTACLAHVNVTQYKTGTVSRIAGYPFHNERCGLSYLAKLPAVPLHDHVWEVALQQLAVGARFVQTVIIGSVI